MKKRLRRKLHSNSGASIVAALAIFTILTIISALIVNSAMANAARLRSEKESEQEFLTVTSAAQKLEDALSGCMVVVEKIEIDGEDELKIASASIGFPEIFRAYVEAAAMEAVKYKEASGDTQTGASAGYRISVHTDEDKQGLVSAMRPVEAEFAQSLAKGEVTILLSLEGESSYAASLRFAVYLDSDQEILPPEDPDDPEETPIVVTRYTVTWEDASLSPVEGH